MAHYEPHDVMRQMLVTNMSNEVLDQITLIKGSGQAMYTHLDGLPQSAEMTLAKRKVEEAVMWAVKAVTA